MLDSERTFKIKVRSHWTVFGILFTQELFAFKEFAWKRDFPISSKFKTSQS